LHLTIHLKRSEFLFEGNLSLLFCIGVAGVDLVGAEEDMVNVTACTGSSCSGIETWAGHTTDTRQC
jgi:hypothetical protein